MGSIEGNHVLLDVLHLARPCAFYCCFHLRVFIPLTTVELARLCVCQFVVSFVRVSTS